MTSIDSDFERFAVSAAYLDPRPKGQNKRTPDQPQWLVSVLIDSFARTMRFDTLAEAKAFRDQDPYALVREVRS